MNQKKLEYIDALRGWAVLLVISSHVGLPITELPYPIRKLGNFGWYGVQLFFLASALTLLLSWHGDGRRVGSKISEFFIRRIFRIAPLYYLGAVFYFYLTPPSPNWAWAHVWKTLLFINSWNPEWVPTTPGWTVVPGGWSISVEFSFYVFFPLLALIFRTFLRVAAFVILSTAGAIFFNAWMGGEQSISLYGRLATENYLYFWLPNQLPVFALGFLTYFFLSHFRRLNLAAGPTHIAAALVILAMVLVAQFYSVQPHYIHGWTTPPPMLVASGCFVLIILLLSTGHLYWLQPLWIRRMGVRSFSMYMLNIAAIDVFAPLVLGAFGENPQGVRAIGAFCLLWLVVVMSTFAAAGLTHRFIEEPGNFLARAWIQRLRRT